MMLCTHLEVFVDIRDNIISFAKEVQYLWTELTYQGQPLWHIGKDTRDRTHRSISAVDLFS
jgi:hypothetical protein